MQISFINSIRVLAVLVIAAVAVPLEAKGVANASKESRLSDEPQFGVAVTPENSQENDIVIPVWIPGFDDVETPPNHARYFLRKPTGVDTFSGTLRFLFWLSQPAPVKHMQDLLPKL